jgi:hypothetical protein
MRQVLEDLEFSGLSQREFAHKRGIPLSTLTWWRKRLGDSRPRSRRDPRPSTLIPVTMLEPRREKQTSAGPIEIRLGAGHVVSIPAGTDAATLRQVFEAVGVGC